MKLNASWWSLFIYIISFFLPVFTDMETMGYQAFFLAINDIPEYPFAFISWFANLFFIAGVIQKKPKGKAICALIATLLGLIVLLEPTIEIIETDSSQNDTVFIAYYCWLLSFIVLFITSCSAYFNQKKSHLL